MTYWTACYCEPQAEYKAREGVEALDRGAFLPTFVHTHTSRGRLRDTEHPILKGYLLVALDGIDDEAWGVVNHIPGVHHVLTNNNRPCRVSEPELSRLMLAHASGTYNIIQARSSNGRFSTAKKRRRRARPRPGRKARSSTYIIGENTDGMRIAS